MPLKVKGIAGDMQLCNRSQYYMAREVVRKIMNRF